MDINTIRLLFDAGIVVLIWMVQLVIYPGFQYYSKEDLVKWHRQYTFRFSFIVIPLLFGQLLLAITQVVQVQSILAIASLSLVALVWVHTFLQFVPFHNRIAKGKATDLLLKQLVRRNWIRTILWTLICTFSIYNYL